MFEIKFLIKTSCVISDILPAVQNRIDHSRKSCDVKIKNY